MQDNMRRHAVLARGFAALLGALVLAAGGSASAAPTETVLHAFTGSDGAGSQAGLIADSAGNFYGTTIFGGATGNGVVFKLSPGGTETVLYTFTGGSDGANPYAGLIADSAGNLYGTTESGGAPGGAGLVFKISPGGIETVLYTFCSLPRCSDGAYPEAGLIADSSGNLYGTTLNGGATGNGVVFKLSPGGTETVLHTFTGGSDGGSPQAGLIADSAGNLYGTTVSGGASGYGVVFKLTPAGTETVLHSFTGSPSDGANSYTGLIADAIGNLYGTTQNGGASGVGAVFKLSPAGTETVLHSFTGSPSDGAYPEAGLIADSAGNLYGTTEGGASGRGTVFELAGTGFVVPALQVTPAINISTTALSKLLGLLGPNSFSYQLSATTSSANVSISGVPSWLNASFTSATVTTSPITVTFTVNLTAAILNDLGILLGGTSTSTIVFTNTTNGQGNTSITAKLHVL